ncbi:MAG: thiamine ABC transporter substrate-binding protein [Treponema sp.]|nr:thiamine ABC transporter substrate-binding protein [Treponema sp.]
MNSFKNLFTGKFAVPRFFIIIILLALILPVQLMAFPRRDRSSNEVVIWTYSSFISRWGPGPEVARIFEEQTGIKVTFVEHRDAGSILARLLQEGSRANADIVLGLDQNMMYRALDSGLLEAYRPIGAEHILPELVLDPQWRLIPFDYSYFAINYDAQRLTNPPRSLEDLTQPRFANSLVLLDPRTSSPGLGFFGWVKHVYGDAWLDYWERLQPSILTISESWSTGYALYTRGEAPLVLSYTTSPAYHLENEDTDRYRALIFAEGHPLQIEAAGLLRSAPNWENARAFLDFMISPAFQELIPLNNWMYPVIDLPLPASFTANPKSDRPLMPTPATEAELNQWASLMQRLGR